MPLVNKQPFKPNPIPENLNPNDGVFYHELTNEIFTSHDAFFDRFLYCNSLIWTCSKTGKSGLTYKEALDSEREQELSKGTKKKKKGKREHSTNEEGNETATGGDATTEGGEPVKKKKKKYPYDPKKYSMPVPEGFDPSLLTPTGKIDGRKLKSKKNKLLAEELLACQPPPSTSTTASSSNETQGSNHGGSSKQKKKEDEAKRKEDEAKKKEDEAKKKAQLQAELAKERELEAKKKKEAATLARQLERQKKEEERKRAATFLQNWEKKCEDLERDDLRKLPQPVPVSCEISEKLFGDAVFILESLYNLHEVYSFPTIFPDGLNYDTLEEMLIEKQEDGPLGTLLQFLLRTIFDTQPTKDGYNLYEDPSKSAAHVTDTKQLEAANKTNIKSEPTDNDGEHDHDTNGLGSEPDEDDDNEDKDVNMNDLIGSAIRAAQEVKNSLSKPLPEMELNSTSLTGILRLHLLQSGSFPKGRTIYNGWYSSREDPGLWLCMQEPDLIKKLSEKTIYDLNIEERIKIINTLIYQLFSFIKTRTYVESASDNLTELRKQYRKEAADFARWDRENCVKRLQPPKRKNEQTPASNQNSDKSTSVNGSEQHLPNNSNPCSINGDTNDHEQETHESNEQRPTSNDKESNNNQQLKSCLKANGLASVNDTPFNDNDDAAHFKKKITFKTGMNDSMGEDEMEECEGKAHDEKGQHSSNHQEGDDPNQTYEEMERAYQQNLVDYEDYQRERAIRYEELNQKLLDIRSQLRINQSIYGIHPIGRDRAYRRYWLFQSLPGLFVEMDDEYLGKCLPNPTPLESRYKKLFNKDNPLMHPIESDLIRTKTCDVACSTEATSPESGNADDNPEEEANEKAQDQFINDNNSGQATDGNNQLTSDRSSGGDAHDNHDDEHDNEPCGLTDEMNYCTGDETTCAIHGQKRIAQPRWWFYHTPEQIDSLIECLNKRGQRESELQDILSIESSIIKPEIVKCPAYKLNKTIFEQSGIRRSRRLRTKGKKRRGRRYRNDED